MSQPCLHGDLDTMWGIGAAGIGAPWVWLLIGSVGFQGNDITGQAWFEGGEHHSK